MSIRRAAWAPGIPCWVDLATADVAASAAFYGEVLGWTPPPPTSEPDAYVVVEVGGAAVAGMFRLRVEGPRGWTVCLATDALEASVERAVSQGARLLSPPAEVVRPGDVGPLGGRAVVRDPQGHAIGLWMGANLNGSQLVNEPGGLCWEELRSPDPTASVRFYDRLFDYAFEPEPPYGPDYSSFRLAAEDVGLGGIRAVGDGPLSAGWIPFFGVPDAGTAARLTREHGGSVLVPDHATPRDHVAYLSDPEGNGFGVVTSTGDEQPDRSG